jgi:ankyrin repeat protein
MIWKLINNKDCDQLQAYLKGYKKKDLIAALNTREEGNTPFLFAVQCGHIGLIKALLQYSQYFNVNAQDLESGYTALHKVCSLLQSVC